MVDQVYVSLVGPMCWLFLVGGCWGMAVLFGLVRLFYSPWSVWNGMVWSVRRVCRGGRGDRGDWIVVALLGGRCATVSLCLVLDVGLFWCVFVFAGGLVVGRCVFL